MATQGYIFTTIHNDGVHNAPLPVREARLGECAGSIVPQADWAFIADCIVERQHSSSVYPVECYPHQMTFGGSVYDYARFVDDYKRGAEFYFIDPETTPQDGDGKWTEPAFTPSAPRIYYGLKPPRSLDTMRRIFYDLKRLTRWRCTANHEYKDDFGDWRSTFYPQWSKDANGDEDFDDPQANRRSPIALDSIHASVRAASGWTIAPAFAAVQFWAWEQGGSEYYKHIIVALNADGSVSPTRWTSADCRSFAASKGLTSNNCYCNARVVGAYYDCTFPHQADFTGWNWEPDGGDEQT